MYCLLIVDNERIVVDSLLHFFNRRVGDQLEMRGAYSANEALEVMEREKVDILLTDIRMPGMDGLQLQKEVSARWPWCITIFLTGFNDFSYVQEAMRSGGMDYLLKTEGNEAILSSVLRATMALDDQLKTDELISQAEAHYKMALPLLNHKLLLELLTGWIAVPDDLAIRFKAQHISLNPKRVWPIYIRFDDNIENVAYKQDMILPSIAAIIKTYLGESGAIEQVQLSRDTLVWLTSVGENWSIHRRQVYLHGIIEAVQQQCTDKLGIHFSACIAREDCTWDMLAEIIERCKYRLNLSVNSDSTGNVIFNRLMTDTEPRAENYSSGALRVMLDRSLLLEEYLESGNRFAFRQELERIFSALEGASQGEGMFLRQEAYHEMMYILMRQLNRWQLQNAVCHTIDFGAFRHDSDWSQLVQDILTLADAIFEAKQHVSLQGENNMIERIRRTVENNLGGDLSLIKLGETEGISAGYLARLYRELTGESLKGYISRMRLERAKQLLETEKNMRNRDIGMVIGFSTEQSFNRFFKSMCGMTPQEYRQSVLLKK